MTPDDVLLDRPLLEKAFNRLANRLSRRGLAADIYVSVALPWPWPMIPAARLAVLAEAHAVAEELGLPTWWLNEQASAYVAPGGDPSGPRVFDHPALRVTAASPEHLLAMKVLAARRPDIGDIRLLVAHLRLRSPDDVLALSRRVFPDEEPPARARLLLEDIIGGT